MYGQICGSACLMQRSARRSKHGLSRNQNSIMPDNYVVSSTLNQMMKNLHIPLETLVESWKFRCQQQCHVSKTKYACIVDADETVMTRSEGVPHRYHEGHISAKGINSLSQYNLMHKFIPMPRALKIQDAKAAVEK